MDKLFMSKKNRDQAWKDLGKEEKARHRRSSMRGQQLHPQYVDDWEQETGRSLSESEKGFGNTIYKTFFGVLYSIEPKYF